MSGSNIHHDQIVDAIYDSALQPEQLSVLIDAWDSAFNDGEFQSAEKALSESIALFCRHFERADQIYLSTQSSQNDSLSSIVNSQPTSAFICDTSGKIKALNSAAESSLHISQEQNIFTLPLDAKALRQLQQFLKQLSIGIDTSVSNIAIRAQHGVDSQNSFVLLAQRLDIDSNESTGSPLILFTSSLATWHSGIEEVLVSAFDLTRAEIEIIQSLNQGMSLKEIAEHRHRSLDTIRTQIKNILQKTDTQNQTNLMRHVTSLLLVANALVGDADSQESANVTNNVAKFHSKVGNTIYYKDYFSANEKQSSQTVVLFAPVLSLDLHPLIVNAFLEKSCRLIVVNEREDETSSFVKHKDKYDELLNDFEQLFKHLKLSNMVLLGHCAGGILAVDYANRYPEKVTAVVCLDTGAPLQSKTQWEKMGKTARRTFAIAKKLPALLYMPHRIVARDFFSSEKGQARVLNYFYADHTPDVELVSKSSIEREWAMSMLSFNFSDVTRPIRASEFWVQDWSQSLFALAESKPIVFIHGEHNKQFHIDDIQQLSDTFDNIQLKIADNAAQLTFISHVDLLVDTIKEYSLNYA